MRDIVAAFTHETCTCPDALSTLSAVGFSAGSEREVERTVRDSFDGRLHANGERFAALVVAHRVRRAQRRLLARGRSITADSPPEELHELRKDAKKLRYLLECFGDLLATKPRKALVRRLKALQENLGAHQDNAVHVAELHSMAHELGAQGASVDTLVAIGGLAAHLDQRRLAARTEFATQFASYDSGESKRALRKMLAGLE